MNAAARDRVVDELRRAWDGEPWHGQALRTRLRDFPAEKADERPVADAHTATEIVLHLGVWTREVSRRLRDGVARDQVEEDWPAADRTAFRAAVDELGAAHEALLREVGAFAPERLHDLVDDARDGAGDARISYAAMLHGITQHYAYHGGQVALLHKALSR